MAKNTFRQKRGAKKQNQTKKRNQVKKMRVKKMQRGGEPHKTYKMYYAVNANNEAKKIMYADDLFIGGTDNITLEDFHTFLLEDGVTFIAIYIKTDLTNTDNQIMFDEFESYILTQILSGSTVDAQYRDYFFRTGTGKNKNVTFGLLPSGNSVPVIVKDKDSGSIILVTKKVPDYRKGELDSEQEIVNIVPMVIGFDVPPPSSKTLNFERMDAKLRINRQEQEELKEAQRQLQEQERQQQRQQQQRQEEAQKEKEEECISQRRQKYYILKQQHTWDTLNNTTFIQKIKDRSEDPCENKESDWGMPFYDKDFRDAHRLKMDNILRENAMTESASELQQPPENTSPVTPPPPSRGYFNTLTSYLPTVFRGLTTTENTKIMPKQLEYKQKPKTTAQKVEEKTTIKRNQMLAHRATFLKPKPR